MKTKFKPLIILIAVFIVSLVSGVVAGCSIGEKTVKELADQRGLTCPVTYYANGGNFMLGGDPIMQVYNTIYFRPGSPIYNIGASEAGTKGLGISREGFVFNGWYFCKLDEQGNPILKDEQGNVLAYLDNGTADMAVNGVQRLEAEKRFNAVPDESRPKAFTEGNIIINEGERLFLIADWIKDVELEYRLVTDTPMTVEVEGKQEQWDNDHVLVSDPFGIDLSKTLKPENAPVKSSTHSYINLYWDKDCKNPVVLGDSIPKPTDGKNAVIYAKYLSDSWTPVRTALDVSSLFASKTENVNYFITNDINCSNIKFSPKAGFNSVIEGNGYKLSNFTMNQQQPNNGQTLSVLGNVGKDAKIKNLTIENVNIEVSIRRGYSVSIFALLSGMEEGAVFEEFHVTGFTVKISRSDKEDKTAISNIQQLDGETFKTDNWLYGASGTDAEFIAAHGEIVQNATLIIDNITVIQGGHNE